MSEYSGAAWAWHHVSRDVLAFLVPYQAAHGRWQGYLLSPFFQDHFISVSKMCHDLAEVPWLL